MSTSRSYLGQVLRFGAVGLVANGVGFLLYLALTHFGLSPQVTVGILYPVGALLGYFGNKQLTFRHRGEWWSSGWRYFLVHSLGMLINLVILSYFVKVAGFAHQWVQLAAILVVALYVFLAMRWFVFPSRQVPRVAKT